MTPQAKLFYAKTSLALLALGLTIQLVRAAPISDAGINATREWVTGQAYLTNNAAKTVVTNASISFPLLGVISNNTLWLSVSNVTTTVVTGVQTNSLGAVTNITTGAIRVLPN